MSKLIRYASKYSREEVAILCKRPNVQDNLYAIYVSLTPGVIIRVSEKVAKILAV